MMSCEDLLAAEDLAMVLDVSPSTIRRWVQKKIIPDIRITSRVQRFCYADVLNALREQSAKMHQAEAVKGGCQ